MIGLNLLQIRSRMIAKCTLFLKKNNEKDLRTTVADKTQYEEYRELSEP